MCGCSYLRRPLSTGAGPGLGRFPCFEVRKCSWVYGFMGSYVKASW